jgi:hypothetical protein
MLKKVYSTKRSINYGGGVKKAGTGAGIGRSGTLSKIVTSQASNSLIQPEIQPEIITTQSLPGSLKFDDAYQYLSLASANVLELYNTRKFTIETYIYPTSSVGDGISIFSNLSSDQEYNLSSLFYFNINDNTLSFYFISLEDGNGYTITGRGQPIPLYTWTHMALSVDLLGKVRMFIQGIELVLTNDIPFIGTFFNYDAIRIGNWVNNGSNRFNLKGYLTNFRINTNALYTENFTPSYPLTAIPGTTLLLLTNSNSPTSSSSNNNVTVTNNSNISWDSRNVIYE